MTKPSSPAPAPVIGLIWAQSRNGIIGHQGGMPWHIPEDLAHFKRTTLRHPVIMGRKTWDSLPAAFRPLPERENIVISRQAHWAQAGAKHAGSLAAALDMTASAHQVWIIGGAQIFHLALPRAHRVIVTLIDADYDGDTPAPHLDASWQLTAQQTQVASQGIQLTFNTYQRIQP